MARFDRSRDRPLPDDIRPAYPVDERLWTRIRRYRVGLWRAIHGAPPSGALRATESAPGEFLNAPTREASSRSVTG